MAIFKVFTRCLLPNVWLDSLQQILEARKSDKVHMDVSTSVRWKAHHALSPIDDLRFMSSAHSQ
ncbi:MAG: hypothetical protein DMG21_03225 [Acidobacteria bacterium]|nr:MAG: hypothetical protein DMG21_03225 [Acidobacteriota bacterium]